ncbi:hypothetical protein [Verrucosispora sp. WMMC514]|uniref:hypothetical protein n=1 Tax=Verrucosispora sp. WMMC514 TaxID=3015156 RepID=UPI00248AEE41|nr:hypothetical protein [Verrucosispora sp. WMMC514]WBB91806.1 hypothetical protein O7597_01795 [Verrucosispora sp. WMMC514]
MSATRHANAVPAARWPTRRAARPAVAPGGTREDGTPRVTPGVYLLTRDASPQFARPITVRVIRERTGRSTYDGWAWIEVYQLDSQGEAIDRRELYVRPDGMRPAPPLRHRTPARRAATRTAG